jgi:hypothetical protein
MTQALPIAPSLKTPALTTRHDTLRLPRSSHKAWIRAFLAALRQCGNVRAACQAAGRNRTYVYLVRQHDRTFRAQWDDALEDAVDALEQAAWERALTGQSDRLTEFLLKAHRPAKCRETVRQEVSGPAGGPVHFIEELSPQEQAVLHRAIRNELSHREAGDEHAGAPAGTVRAFSR